MTERTTINPSHPGALLREALAALPGMDVTHFAETMGVSRVAVSRVLNGKAGVSAAMALSLADALGTTAEMWLNAQMQYDLWHAREDRREIAERAKLAECITGAVYRSASRPGRLMRVMRGDSRVRRARPRQPITAAA